jgi:hypothetical protein
MTAGKRGIARQLDQPPGYIRSLALHPAFERDHEEKSSQANEQQHAGLTRSAPEQENQSDQAK